MPNTFIPTQDDSFRNGGGGGGHRGKMQNKFKSQKSEYCFDIQKTGKKLGHKN
jgi:hypothetical protein